MIKNVHGNEPIEYNVPFFATLIVMKWITSSGEHAIQE